MAKQRKRCKWMGQWVRAQLPPPQLEGFLGVFIFVNDPTVVQAVFYDPSYRDVKARIDIPRAWVGEPEGVAYLTLSLP